MRKLSTASGWTRHLFYRTEVLRTTWKFRIALLTLAVVAVWLSSGWWTAAIAHSLVCGANPVPSDAILIENLDSDYLLFERATQLRGAGMASRVLALAPTDTPTQQPNEVDLGTVRLMAAIARTGAVEIIPIREIEPITLNAARDVQRFLEREHIRSVIVVTPQFRSRRSALVYDATVGSAGITVRYQPVQGSRGVDEWSGTWHGIQNVAEQWLKLQYYRLYVLPFRVSAHREP